MPAHVISRGGDVPDMIAEGEITVPTFEIAVNPTIQLSEVSARRFYIADRAQVNARASIQAEEDRNIFDAINATIPQCQIEQEEEIQNEYLIYMKEYKSECELEQLKQNTPHYSIMWLEI